jgi:RNA polymerase sigma factor (sigma-70 family)
MRAVPGGDKDGSIMESAFSPPLLRRGRGAGVPGPAEGEALTTAELGFDGLVRRMGPRMMRSIWRIVRHREAAEDAYQDALTVIWKKREAVSRHPNPEALVLRIAVDAAYDAVRRSRRRLRREVAGLDERAPEAGARTVTEDVEARSLRLRVLEAIGRLPRKQATAALLRLVEERPYAEIAAAMGCSEATARVHVMRARTALARRLAPLLVGAPRPSRDAAVEPGGTP